MDFKSKIILIYGPTASGKSKFAIKLAKKISGQIINADSMQVYKELKVLTARPFKKDYQTANLWLNNISMYGYNLKGTNTSNPPLWHKDYLLNEYYNYQEYYWNKISLNKIKDLKNIWEL